MKITASMAPIAPAILSPSKASAYNLDEIEAKLKSGRNISGVTKRDLPTPALILDLDRCEGNILKMAEFARGAGINLRPHAKMHKCVEIARRQIAAGAHGVSVATIREGEVMADAGVRGILVTSEMVGPNKMARLIRLTKKAPDTMSVVDNPAHASQLSEAAVASKVVLNIMVDIDPIGRRTGIEPGEKAVALAEKIDSLPNLNLCGVHSYSGASSHVVGFAERKAHSEKYMAAPLESFAQMRKQGLPVEIMSGTSTGTYNIDPGFGGMTEMQVGSYAVMDVDYRRIGGKAGEVYDDFAPALTVLATVISKSHDDRATLDSGLKSFATDRKFGPELVGVTGVDFRFGGDEHGILEIKDPNREIRLGDKLELIVPHCDPNINLYDFMYVVQGDNVKEIWKVDARGQV